MTQNPDIQEPPRTEEDIAHELRLRPDPPRVMRLSRGAIAFATAIGGLGLGAVLIVALQNNRQEGTQTELFSTERIQAAKGLSTLPRDYADVPRLGPPLPGELGRAILGAQDRGQPVPAPPLSGPLAPTVDPEEQRRLQELDAARLSALFAEAQTVPRSGTQATPTSPATGALFPSTLGSPTASDPISGREAFLTRPGDTDTVSAQPIVPPPNPYILQAGTVIPAALITGLRSDLPGQISAQVTSNVFDRPSCLLASCQPTVGSQQRARRVHGPTARSRRKRKHNPMASKVKHLWSQTLRRIDLHTDRTLTRPSRIRSLRSRSDPPSKRSDDFSDSNGSRDLEILTTRIHRADLASIIRHRVLKRFRDFPFAFDQSLLTRRSLTLRARIPEMTIPAARNERLSAFQLPSPHLRQRIVQITGRPLAKVMGVLRREQLVMQLLVGTPRHRKKPSRLVPIQRLQ